MASIYPYNVMSEVVTGPQAAAVSYFTKPSIFNKKPINRSSCANINFIPLTEDLTVEELAELMPDWNSDITRNGTSENCHPIFPNWFDYDENLSRSPMLILGGCGISEHALRRLGVTHVLALLTDVEEEQCGYLAEDGKHSFKRFAS